MILSARALLLDAGRWVEGGGLLIARGKIASVLASRRAVARARTAHGGRFLELDGLVLTPGLVDAHVHSEGNRAPIGEPDEEFGPEETARRMVYAGVTAYLDLGLDADTIFDARERQRTGALPGADIYAAGQFSSAWGAEKTTAVPASQKRRNRRGMRWMSSPQDIPTWSN